MKKLLLRAFVLRRRWSDLADSTRYQYRYRLYRDLDNILALLPTQEDGLRLQKRYRELRENLSTGQKVAKVERKGFYKR